MCYLLELSTVYYETDDLIRFSLPILYYVNLVLRTLLTFMDYDCLLVHK